MKLPKAPKFFHAILNRFLASIRQCWRAEWWEGMGLGRWASQGHSKRSDRRSPLSDYRGVLVQALEQRAMLTDFGDAPLPYPVTTAENGARHT